MRIGSEVRGTGKGKTTIKSTINLKHASAAVRAKAADALTDAAEHILEESNRTIPIDEGTLMRSGTASVDRAKLQAAVAYDTPYARRAHEDTRLRHPNGRRAKFLTLTLKERAEPVRDLIAKALREVFK